MPHPEFIAIPPHGRRTAIVFLPGETESFDIIDPTLVSSLSFDGGGGQANGEAM